MEWVTNSRYFWVLVGILAATIVPMLIEAFIEPYYNQKEEKYVANISKRDNTK